MDEAVLAAKTAYERLNSDTDTDFAAVYKLLFLTDKNKDDPTFKKVTKNLKCIADLDINSLPKIKDADIRIFCDNDKIDLDSDGRDVANGGRWKKRGDADNGWLWGWQDKTNILQSVRGQDDPFMPPQGSNFMPDTALNLDEKDRPGCQNEGINGYKNSLAATFTIPLEDKTRQPKESSAITICDKLLKGEKGNINKLPLFKDVKTKELSSLQEGIDTFRSTLSHVMLHELTHTNHCGDTEDQLIVNPRDLPRAAEWEM